jgi:glutaminyl-tRNA synthetase
MAVLRPLKVIIDNYPEGQVEEMDAVNNPEDPAAGTRKVPFSKVLYIEQEISVRIRPRNSSASLPDARFASATAISSGAQA